MRLPTKILVTFVLIVVVVLTIVWGQYQKFLTTPLQIGEDGYVYTVDNGSNLLKIVFFDEADVLTPQAQMALKNTIEQYSKNCRFIFINFNMDLLMCLQEYFH